MRFEVVIEPIGDESLMPIDVIPHLNWLAQEMTVFNRRYEDGKSYDGGSICSGVRCKWTLRQKQELDVDVPVVLNNFLNFWQKHRDDEMLVVCKSLDAEGQKDSLRVDLEVLYQAIREVVGRI
jgi:hypothetical protein